MTHKSPLLLIPGQLCTSRVWKNQVSVLSEFSDCQVCDHTQDDSIAGMASTILKQAPDRFSLVGHAMGGFIAFEIMRQVPECVERLALLDTLATADTAEQIQRRKYYQKLVESGRFEELISKRYPVLLNDKHENDSRMRDLIHEMAIETGPETFLRQQSAIMHRQDSRPTLKDIRCPTLVLTGREDKLASVKAAEVIANGISCAELNTIEDSGHLTMIEQPKLVNQYLTEWMSK